jgi:DegV family protein with EDD domain
MAAVTILTDSSAYIPEDITRKYGIEVIPLQLIWEGKSFLDGVDIKADEFYTRLKTAEELPTTSATSVHEYQVRIQRILDEGKSVVVMPISSGISASYLNAVQAKKLFADQPVEVIDTRLVSMALGFMAITAARAAADGASLAEVKELAERSYSHIGVYFTVDDLKYLHKGGRIGSAKRLMGSALKIKPILEIADGKIEAVGSVMTRKKAFDRLVSLVEEGIGGRTPVRISVFHALDKETAEQLQALCVDKFGAVEAIMSEVSPVVGAHVGAGTMSIAYMAGM